MVKESKRDKRYYWLKLNDDFFEDDTMEYLEEQENGKEHALIYLKLLVRSVKTDGKLYRLIGDKLMPYDEKFLAKITNSTVDTVKVAMDRFVKLGLVEKLETGEIYMKQIDEMVGSETGHAKQKRLLRARETMSLECLDDVSEMSHRDRVRDRDRDRDKEKDIPSHSEESDRETLQKRFDVLWNQYPKGRKQGKDSAFKSYKRATKDGVTDESILKGLNAYKQQIKLQKTEVQYIKQGGTWFNGKCWNDEYITQAKSANKLEYVDVPKEFRT